MNPPAAPRAGTRNLVTSEARSYRRGRLLGPLLVLAMLAACAEDKPSAPREVSMDRSVIPAPASVVPAQGVNFEITEATRIVAPPGTDAGRIGEQLAALLRRSTGFPVETGPGGGTLLRCAATGR